MLTTTMNEMTLNTAPPPSRSSVVGLVQRVFTVEWGLRFNAHAFPCKLQKA